MTCNLLRVSALMLSSLAVAGCEDLIEGVRDYAGTYVMYAPGSSMEPTIPTGSRFTVHRAKMDELQRGGVYIVGADPKDARVLRLIGMPGDTVALREGIVVLDGERAATTPQGEYSFETEDMGPKTGARIFEVLPGSDIAYEILDLGPTPLDTFGPITLAADQYFFLGDNRDNAADSRVPIETLGVRGIGLVHAEEITHQVDLKSVSN